MTRRTASLAAVLAAVLLLVACRVDGPGGPPAASDPPDPTSAGTPATATAEPLVVVATVSPLADLVARVGGERVDVRPLVAPGADAHTWSPRPRDAMRLSEADAYVGVGLGLNAHAIDLAESNLPEHGVLVLLGEEALSEDDLVLDHSHDHDHDHTHGDGDDGSADGEVEESAEPVPGPNPHVWTSVRNTSRMVEAIRATLTGLDPDGAGAFRRNADQLVDDLRRLDDTITAAVASVPEENRVLVTYHDAWTYFARDHGLRYAVAVQMGDHSEPSAAEVRRLIDLIRELDVPAVFGSEAFPTPVLEVIAEETGAAYHDGLSDDILPGRPGDPEHSYLELMRRNAVIIVDGLGGDADELHSWSPSA